VIENDANQGIAGDLAVHGGRDGQGRDRQADQDRQQAWHLRGHGDRHEADACTFLDQADVGDLVVRSHSEAFAAQCQPRRCQRADQSVVLVQALEGVVSQGRADFVAPCAAPDILLKQTPPSAVF
jgi:hypothetical protein